MFLSWTLFLCCIPGLKAVSLLLSESGSIKLLKENITQNTYDVTTLNTLAIAVDYHYNREEIYYSDNKGNILRLKSKKNTTIILVKVIRCQGLAVDWINDNLYWTDIDAHKVEMATLDGLYRRKLFDTSHGVEKPRGIVLDPSEGLLFWSDWGQNARVESSGLDGNGKLTVMSSDLVWPNGLTLDLSSKKLYILDGYKYTISSCNYDGSDLRVIKTSSNTVGESFALTFYDNRLYWTHYFTLLSMDVGSGDIQSVYNNMRANLRNRMMGLKAVHPTLQSPSSTPNPCQSAGCSHRCLVSRTLSATCICPYGFTLQSDNKICVEEGYLVTSWRKAIYRYSLQGSNEEVLINNIVAVIAIDYHLKKDFIFWSNIEEHRIYRAPLGQLNNKTVVAVAHQCDGLAVDWLHDVIYWTDTYNNTLEVAELDGSNRKTIFSDHLDNPRAIVVDPHSRYIFWTDWGSIPKLERAVLDGSDRQTIISSDISWPNGMTLDLDKKIMYWVDGKLATISSCDYNGSNRKSLLSSTVFSFHPFSITSFQDKLYWTDWVTQSLFQINKDSVNELKRIANHSTTIQMRPNQVKVVHSSLQPEGENSCESIRCRDICLGSADPQRGHCMGELEEEEDIDVRIGDPAVLTAVVNNDSIVLTYSGKIQSFAAIHTRCTKRVGCSDETLCSKKKEKLSYFEDVNIFNITELLPAAHYNLKFLSPDHEETLVLVTKANTEDYMGGHPEIPVIGTLVVEDKVVNVTWYPVDTCVPGFESYHYKVFKNTSNQDVVLEGSTNFTEVLLSNLKPGMNYSIRVYTYNENYFSTVAFSIESDENEEVPSCMQEEFLCDGIRHCDDENSTLCAEIESVAVYKKSAYTIYFRCQVQNRTAKNLEKFVGNYSMSGSSVSQSFEAVAEPCIIWPEYYCFNVSGLREEKVYNFSISAALRDKRVGDHVEVSATTKEEASGSPEDVKITSYTPTSVIIEWRYPNMSNGIIKSFIINVHLMKKFKEEKCHLSPFPIFESPAEDEQEVYIHEISGLCPASSYAISISAMNKYLGVSSTLDVNTPPPPTDIMRQPNVQLSSLTDLSWKPEKDLPTDLPQYEALIKSYILLLLPSKGDNQTSSNPASLQMISESEIGSNFKVLWHKHNDDEEAFKQPIKVENLEPHKQYQLAWVQVSQYNNAYGIDYILSDYFIAL